MNYITSLSLFFCLSLLTAELPDLKKSYTSSDKAFVSLLNKENKTQQDYDELAHTIITDSKAENLFRSMAFSDKKIYRTVLALTADKNDLHKMYDYASLAMKNGVRDGYYYLAHAGWALRKLTSIELQIASVLHPLKFADSFQEYHKDLWSRMFIDLYLKRVSIVAYYQGRSAMKYNDPTDAYKNWLVALCGDVYPNVEQHFLDEGDGRAAACVGLGFMWETETVPEEVKKRKNKDACINEAYNYYKRANNLIGEVEIARLSWIGAKKDTGISVDQAKTIFEKGSQRYPFAGFCHATNLFSEGKHERAVELLKNLFAKYYDPLINLQLAIAHHFGLGVEKDHDFVRQLCSFIICDGRGTRESLLAKGYLHFFGIGMSQDQVKGKDFFNQAEKAESAFQIPTHILLPELIREMQLYDQKQREAKYDDLLRELERESELESAKKTKRKNKNNKSAFTSAASSFSPFREELASIKYTGDVASPIKITEKKISRLGTPTDWKLWYGDMPDGSFVSATDEETQTITVNSPEHCEQIIVFVENDPYQKYSLIKSLIKHHDRIKNRAGKSKKLVDQKTAKDHDFALALDHVMQEFGKYVPFIKSQETVQDTLVADVIRKGEDGQEIACIAEYGYRLDKDKAVVFHRLLRTTKNQEAALAKLHGKR